MRRTVRTCGILTCAVVVFGGEASIRTTPLDVVSQPYIDGASRITADWGTQGDTIARSAQSVRDEYDQLQAFLHSPEMQRYRAERQKQALLVEEAQGRQLVADWRERYEHVGQVCALPERATVATRTVPAPEWTANMPWDLRATLVVAAFDSSKPAQVAWAEALRARYPLVQTYAVAWSSLRDFHQVGKDHPLVQALVVTDVPGLHSVEQWLADFGITGLPAVVTFPDREHLRIEEGLAP